MGKMSFGVRRDAPVGHCKQEERQHTRDSQTERVVVEEAGYVEGGRERSQFVCLHRRPNQRGKVGQMLESTLDVVASIAIVQHHAIEPPLANLTVPVRAAALRDKLTPRQNAAVRLVACFRAACVASKIAVACKRTVLAEVLLAASIYDNAGAAK